MFWSAEQAAVVATKAVQVKDQEGCLLYEAVDLAQRETLPEDQWRQFTSNSDVVADAVLTRAITSSSSMGVKVNKATLPDYSRNGAVSWDQADFEMLALPSAELMATGYDMLSAVLLAQETALPQGRRRKLRALTQIHKELRSRIDTKLKLLPEKKTPDWNKLATSSHPEQLKPDEPIPEHTSDTLIAKVIDEFKRALDARLGTMEELLLELLSKDQKPVEKPVERTRKPKVLIIGLYTTNFQRIEEAWGKHFDLSLIEIDKRISPDKVSSSDWVVGCLKSLSHGMAETILKHISSEDRFIRVLNPGGEMIKVLGDIWSRHKKSVEVTH